MNNPILPLPVADHPEPTSGSGEGAQTALAALIRKRKMGENHVEHEALESLPKQATGEP